LSPAEPKRQPSASRQVVEEPDANELLHVGEPSTREPGREQRHLRLVRQQARQRANRRYVGICAGIAVVLGVCMGLVTLRVLIAENQFKLDNLQQQAAVQQEAYERLRLAVAELESPARIVSVAEGKLGMQQPGSVSYLPAVPTSAGGGSPGASGSGAGSGSAGLGAGSGSGRSSAAGTTVNAPEGVANWPMIKPYLSGGP